MSPFRFGLALILCISAAPALAAPPGGPPVPSAPAVAPPSPIVEPVQSEADALGEDAGEYARVYGMPIADAYRRLAAQSASVAATDRLRARYRDRLAGLVLEHRPDFRLVVLLTGDAPVPDDAIRAGGLTIPVTFRTGAAATREQIVAAIRVHQAEIRAALPRPPALGADPRTGELVVMTYGALPADADALTARFAALTGVPVRIESLAVPAKNLALEGGARVEGVADGRRFACTTGFVVTDGSRRGLVTAAHCPDSLDFIGPNREKTALDFLGQWGWGFQDVQLHAEDPASGDAPLRPLFFADTAKRLVRPVTAALGRASTRAGDFVCHRGESTGYSCSEVQMTDFAPAGDLCGGACLPSWVTVAGPTCKGGDSGSPVFLGTIALGIVKGGSYRADGGCIFYFYMSTDYLPQGWALLGEQGPLAVAADRSMDAIAGIPPAPVRPPGAAPRPSPSPASPATRSMSARTDR